MPAGAAIPWEGRPRLQSEPRATGVQNKMAARSVPLAVLRHIARPPPPPRQRLRANQGAGVPGGRGEELSEQRIWRARQRGIVKLGEGLSEQNTDSDVSTEVTMAAANQEWRTFHPYFIMNFCS